MSRKKILSFILGLGISAFCFYLVSRKIRWGALQQELTKIDLNWCFLAVAIYLLGHILRGVRCSWILRPYRKLTVLQATQVVWIGYAANNVLPARLGEFVRSYILAKRENLPQGITLSTLFIERILDGVAIAGILFVAALMGPSSDIITGVGWLAGLIFIGATVVLIAARVWKSTFHKLISWGAGFFPQSISGKLEGFTHKLLDGTECLQYDRRTLGVLGLSLLIWLVEAAMFLCLFPAFGFTFSLIAACLTMSMTNLGVLIPSGPSGMGAFHLACQQTLQLTVLAGVATAVAATKGFAYAIVGHALQVIPITLLGIWALYSYGLNLRGVWKMKQAEEKEDFHNTKSSLEPA